MEPINNLKIFLDSKVELYNNPTFIENDPIQIPHMFSKPEDIEIAGFLTATLAWGLRKTIINKAKELLKMMDNSPYNFIVNSKDKDLKPFVKFKHRTFNGDDCLFFINSLKNIYINHGGLKQVFYKYYLEKYSVKNALISFRNIFFETTHLKRTLKHVSDVTKNASAKRLNMFLRWMVRNDKKGVDFGIWEKIKTKDLFIPLDIHCGKNARILNLLTRKQNDWKSVLELTNNLKKLDANDPVKYDFALFGMSVLKNTN